MLELGVAFSSLFAMLVIWKEIPEDTEDLFLIGKKIFLPKIPILQSYIVRSDALRN